MCLLIHSTCIEHLLCARHCDKSLEIHEDMAHTLQRLTIWLERPIRKPATDGFLHNRGINDMKELGRQAHVLLSMNSGSRQPQFTSQLCRLVAV